MAMKTTDKCCRLILGTSAPSVEFDEAIKAIQLDAMKEGARRAAEIASKACYKGGYQFAPELILTAAEQWTEKDL